MKKFLIASALGLALTTGAHAKDIVDTAVSAGSFKTLVTALQAAGLVDTLKGKGPFTVFAPTDEAFAKIPKADLDALLADKAKLTAVLTYHVVSGKVMAADVKAGEVQHGSRPVAAGLRRRRQGERERRQGGQGRRHRRQRRDPRDRPGGAAQLITPRSAASRAFRGRRRSAACFDSRAGSHIRLHLSGGACASPLLLHCSVASWGARR